MSRQSRQLEEVDNLLYNQLGLSPLLAPPPCGSPPTQAPCTPGYTKSLSGLSGTWRKKYLLFYKLDWLNVQIFCKLETEVTPIEDQLVMGHGHSCGPLIPRLNLLRCATTTLMHPTLKYRHLQLCLHNLRRHWRSWLREGLPQPELSKC